MTIEEKIAQSNRLFFELYNSPEYAALKQLVENADETILSGVGKNWYICEKVVKTWVSMGLKCQALDCVHALHGDLGMLKGNTKKVLIFLSKSGTTAEMVTLANIVKNLREKGVLGNLSIVSISLNKDKVLDTFDISMVPTTVKYEDVAEFDERNLVPSLSINTMQMVLDLLGVEIYEEDAKLVDGYKYNHLGGANGKRLGGDKMLS